MRLKWTSRANLPLVENNTYTVNFRHWTFMQPGGSAFQDFSRTYKDGEAPIDEHDIPEVNSQRVTFRQPIKELCVPDSLWIGNLLYMPLVEVLRIGSSLIFAEHRSLFEVPFYQQGDEFPRNQVSDKPRGRTFKDNLVNRGFLVGTDKDSFSFVGPEGKCFQIVNEQLKEKIDEIHRISHQMANSVSSTSKAMGRSGLSKQQDNKAKEKVLEAFGDIVRISAREIYDEAAEARGESVVWQPLGMTDYKVQDRDSLMKEIQTMPFVKGAIPSKTFLKLYTTRLASDLEPSMSPETQVTIKQEIDEAWDKVGLDELYPVLPANEQDVEDQDTNEGPQSNASGS